MSDSPTSQDSGESPPDRSGLDAASAARVLASLLCQEPSPALEPSPRASDPAALPVVPGYTLAERIGGGGGGEVFRAVREGSESPVAIKILRVRLGQNDQSQRAWRELQVLSSIRLPSVPRVLDYGVHDGRLFIVSEYIEALALDRFAADHRLDRRAQVELLARVADALHALHEQGVIHRDIKPSNILVDARADPVIIDLGVASLLAGDVLETLTADGAPIGTPAFMAPEQARGERASISTRTDIYALGAAACFLLTGRTPHDMAATIHEALRRVAFDPPREPRDLDPSLDRSLAAVLARACAPNPKDRYTSAADFADDLRRWARGAPVEARPAGPWTKAARWAARHPLQTAAALGALIILSSIGLSAAAVWWLNARPARVVVSSDQREVAVLSASGRVLRAWTARRTEGRPVALARIVERPDALGGGRALVLLMQNERSESWPVDQLAVFDLNDLNAPAWSTSPGPPELLPPRPATSTDNTYIVNNAILADVFPDRPGLEIIATHSQTNQPAALRVYGLDGQVLYEVWHHGSIGDLAWLDEPRLIVVSGCNNESTWAQLGLEGPSDLHQPLALFAVRPTLGDILPIMNGPFRDPRAQPVWYRYFWPPRLAEHARPLLREVPTDPDHIGRRFEIVFKDPDIEGEFWWVLNKRAEIVFRQATDGYLRHRPEIDWASFGLVERLTERSNRE